MFTSIQSSKINAQPYSHHVYTVPKAAHFSESLLRVYMGASHLAGKFLKAV
jgi:hypothetical protein